MAESLGMIKGGHIDVLDLFSGSGLSARTVLSKQEDWHVYCVDTAIAAVNADLEQEHNVVWLKTDVRQVLGGEEGLLSRKFDLVCMDPPHNALFELLFEAKVESQALIDSVSKVAPWLIVYQGHASQVSRGIALQTALIKRFARVALWHIGPEVVTIAGPLEWKSNTFDEILERAGNFLEQDCRKYGWTLEKR
jgi:16S rRNA G966 N2-methylase RsmD